MGYIYIVKKKYLLYCRGRRGRKIRGRIKKFYKRERRRKKNGLIMLISHYNLVKGIQLGC